MSRNTTVGTCWTGTYFAEIISVSHNMVLVRETLTGREENLPFTDLQSVTPASTTLETFDQLATAFDASYAYDLIVAFTRTTGWADLIKAKWSELY